MENTPESLKRTGLNFSDLASARGGEKRGHLVCGEAREREHVVHEREAAHDLTEHDLNDAVWEWPVVAGKHTTSATLPQLPHACQNAELGALECEQLLLLADGLDGWMRAAGVRGSSEGPSSWQLPSNDREADALAVLSRQVRSWLLPNPRSACLRHV